MSCFPHLRPYLLAELGLGKKKKTKKLEDLGKVHLTSKRDYGKGFLDFFYTYIFMFRFCTREVLFVTRMCHFNLINSEGGETGIEKA